MSLSKWLRNQSLTLAILFGALMVNGQVPNINTQEPGLQTRFVAALRSLGFVGNDEYTIGDGDEIEIAVSSRPELSGHHLVGPDGRITLPLYGPYEIKNKSREAAAQGISKSFEKFYTSVDVTVRVTKYGSNRILVLGHVAKPGVLYFDNAPTLLEALSRSGAGVSNAKDIDPTIPERCAIFRGKDLMAWIDLKEMLENGESLADLRLKRDDVVYIPDERDVQVSVLGEVMKPGLVRIKGKTTLLDVIAMAGGLTPDSGKAKIEVIRPDRSAREFQFHDLLDPAKSIECPLDKGDVVYVTKGGVAKFEYTLRKLSPLGTMMLFGAMLGATIY